MFKLYKYQEEAVSNAVNMLFEHKNSLIVAGTGAGKTIMMAAVIGKFFYGFRAIHKKMPHILVLVHRAEIHGQNHKKFSRVCPEIPTSELTALRKSLRGYVHFGMVQTVIKLLDELTKGGCYFDLIVIDEAHHTGAVTYESIIEWNRVHRPGAALLGVTATPNRGDKLPLVHLFDNFNQITTKFLIDSHYLVRPRFKDLSPVFSSEKGLEKGRLSKNCKPDTDGKEIISNLCDDYLREKEPGKSIVFAPTHEHCAVIFNELTRRGRNPAYLAKGIDDLTRRSELDRFENGDAEELINVDICTEGYDYPPLRNVVDFDTNGTHGQWVQKVGRVLRTADGKTTCTVIDFGGNISLYPEGVETDVNLNGVVKLAMGERLTEEQLFRERKERETCEIIAQADEQYYPYNPPEGFETLHDNDFGIVFVACGEKLDFIITGHEKRFTLFRGNKSVLGEVFTSSFDECANMAVSWLDQNFKDVKDKPISRMQVQLLAPDYPTAALSWYGANCCICWKTWKSEIQLLERM